LNKDTDDEEEVKEQINTIKNDRAPGMYNITGEKIK
jgi:hypothetical protein